MAGENPRKIHPEIVVFFGAKRPFQCKSMGLYIKIPPRLQYLWIPLDVNSLYTGFQACLLKYEQVIVVFPKEAQQEK
jgi:hypothetical protein